MKVIPIPRPLVTRLAGLPDGRLVAGFDDGSLQIFDVYPGHGEPWPSSLMAAWHLPMMTLSAFGTYDT